jgi:LEA14-like dessication related protein
LRPTHLLLLALLAPVGGCVSAAARFQVRSVDRLTVAGVDGTKARLVLAVQIVSQSPVQALVRATSYEVSLAGGPAIVGSGFAAPDVTIPAGGQVTLDLPFIVDLSALPADLPLRVGQGGVPYEAHVKLAITSAVGDLVAEVNPRGTAKLDDRFKMLVDGAFEGDAVRVVAIDPPTLGLGYIDVRVRVAFRPILPFAVKVRSTRYKVSVDGLHLGAAELTQPFEVAPGKPIEVSFPLRVPLMGLGDAARAALGALAGRAVTVQGEVEIAPIGPVSRVPFKVDARL